MKGSILLLAGGGPAPGINTVISSVAKVFLRDGYRVIGLHDGYKNLFTENPSTIDIDFEMADRVFSMGGSMLRMSRYKPADLEFKTNFFVKNNVKLLVTVGGDDTASTANRISKFLTERKFPIQNIHVPKTIDNDLPLPENERTFGYETARAVGANLVQNLMEDAKTTGRWYVIVAMGRHAGHLALGIGKSSGATVTVIAEEFPAGHIPFHGVCDILEGAMLKRCVRGQTHGVAILAEGIAERFSEEDLGKLGRIERDGYGHLRLAEVDLGKIVKDELTRRFAARGEKITLVSKDIGYELRCAPPVAFDCEYVRELGYGAVKFLFDIAPKRRMLGGLVCIIGGKLQPIPFHKMLDPKTHKTRVRMVDIHTEAYEVARRYMIRLEPEDFADARQLAVLAAAAKMTPKEFRARYGYLGK